MKFRIDAFIPLMLMSFFFVSFATVVQADYDYDYFSDRLNREHREAGDVDDWIERGKSTITASPRFEDGIRLTAWSNDYVQDDTYEFAIASAIYFFEIPRQAQYIEILVRYRGEPRKAELEDYEEVAGRIWIRNINREETQRRYDDSQANETIYGDTFVLRAKRRSETIKIATAGHVDNGLMEMHIVAEDGDQLDVESIDVSTYQRQPDIRVVHRYARDYQWRPWYAYTYSYFYDGPFYYSTDLDYYIQWSYPIYDQHYFSIRYAYGNYLHSYYTYHPYYHHHYYSNRYYSTNVNVRVNVDAPVETRRRLNQWTESHETVRSEYTRGRLSKTTIGTTENANIQARVRAVIEKQREEPVLSNRVIQSPAISVKRKRFDVETSSDITIERQRQLLRSSRDSSVRPNDANQGLEKRKRYSSDSQSQNDYNDYTRSNTERRERLYNRSQPSAPTRSVPSSSRESSVSTGSKQRRSVESSPSATPRRETSVTQQTRSSTSTSQKNDDDDDEKKRQSERSQNTERTKRRRE